VEIRLHSLINVFQTNRSCLQHHIRTLFKNLNVFQQRKFVMGKIIIVMDKLMKDSMLMVMGIPLVVVTVMIQTH